MIFNSKIRKPEASKLDFLLLIGGIFALGILLFIFHHVWESGRNLLSIFTLPLIMGIVFENRRLDSEWRMIFLKILVAFGLSLLAFLPGKNEHVYDFERHVSFWPYAFIFFFVLASVIYHDKKVVPKLTEGITLLQSVSIIYWIIDVGFLNFKNVYAYTALAVGALFCLFSFLHAFTYIKLTRNQRLLLSIWSSLIMIIFAADHLYRVSNFGFQTESAILNDSLNFLQYFLLGVSLMYIFQNAVMLIVYLPSKRRFYDKDHLKQIKAMNLRHISRYSRNQIRLNDSLLAVLFSATIYYCNYRYDMIPRNTMIWLLFWAFPIVLWVKPNILNYIQNRHKQPPLNQKTK